MLVIDDLSVRVAGRLLIDQATARHPGRPRVGLVGRNGSGKTTLFNVIAGDVAAEQGESSCRRAGASAGWRRKRPAAPKA